MACKPAIRRRLSSRICRNSSSWLSYPCRIKCPSLASKGNSSASAGVIFSASGAGFCAISASAKISSWLSAVPERFNKSESERALNSPWARAARSRGPPREVTSRERARSISGRVLKISDVSALIIGFWVNHVASPSRASISARPVRGAESRVCNNRAPPAVLVLSIADNRLPLRSPVKVRESSNDFLVAVSITINASGHCADRGLRYGMVSSCVCCKYASKPPAAESICALNCPIPCNVDTS